MSANHSSHEFKGGQLSQVWNPLTRKHESKPQPKWCAVCGRKQDHILHGVGK